MEISQHPEADRLLFPDPFSDPDGLFLLKHRHLSESKGKIKYFCINRFVDCTA